MNQEQFNRLMQVALHRETYNPDANEPQILHALTRSQDALRTALSAIQRLQKDQERAWTFEKIGHWAIQTFGEPKPMTAAARANEEMAELLMHVAKGEMGKASVEAADVVIVLCHLAASAGIDLQAVISEKMEINVARRWNVAGGVGYHVKAPS